MRKCKKADHKKGIANKPAGHSDDQVIILQTKRHQANNKAAVIEPNLTKASLSTITCYQKKLIKAVNINIFAYVIADYSE